MTSKEKLVAMIAGVLGCIVGLIVGCVFSFIGFVEAAATSGFIIYMMLKDYLIAPEDRFDYKAENTYTPKN